LSNTNKADKGQKWTSREGQGTQQDVGGQYQVRPHYCTCDTELCM